MNIELNVKGVDAEPAESQLMCYYSGMMYAILENGEGSPDHPSVLQQVSGGKFTDQIAVTTDGFGTTFPYEDLAAAAPTAKEPHEQLSNS